jgi:hypothetical protein
MQDAPNLMTHFHKLMIVIEELGIPLTVSRTTAVV